MVATAGLIPVGFVMYSLLYNQYITPEKANERVTQIPVQIPASFELITCGVLLKTPKSKARKIKIAAKNNIQTIMIYDFNITNIVDWIVRGSNFNYLI